METNVGPRERLFRLAVGSTAITAALLSSRVGMWRWLLGAWGAANIMTGLTRYCPSNQLFGIDNTRGHEVVHFRAAGVLSPWLARRLNVLQRDAGLTYRHRAA